MSSPGSLRVAFGFVLVFEGAWVLGTVGGCAQAVSLDGAPQVPNVGPGTSLGGASDFAGASPGVQGVHAGEFGATQGGVQDMGLARELIAAGRVPPAEAFVVEGMFSEHELGLTGGECQRLLCLRAAVGVAPTLDNEPAGWMQIGMSSTIDMETYERPKLALIAAVDVSGSMGWGYVAGETEYPTAGEVSRNLLSAIAAELTDDDQVAIVTYGTDVETVLHLTAGDQQGTIQAAIDALDTAGSTNMEGGLIRAYEIAQSAVGEVEEVRVMLFTDIQPNVGATTASEFEQIVEGGVADGISITVMGVGVGLGQELMNAISHIRGGNAFTLFDNNDVGTLMEDDWPWLVSPIAYDLSLAVTPSAGFEATEAYGFPTREGDEPPGFDVSTIFLSRRKGALLIQFTPEQEAEMTGLSAAGRLTYTTPEGEAVEEELQIAYRGEELDDRGQYFEQDSVGKTVALALLVNAMNECATVYGEDQEAAVALMQAAAARFTADAEALGDEAFDPEIELAADLLQLMIEGAEQGDLYGEYENF